MSWIDDIAKKFTRTTDSKSKHEIPEGVWTKCSACDQALYQPELERNLNVCPKCGHHMRIKARTRLEAFLDPGEHVELGSNLEPQDVLRFKDLKRYKDRFAAAQKSTGEKDALVVYKGTLKGIPVVACAFEFSFMGGSMGSVVGARFCLAARECIKEGRALVCFSTSGGARMQESLMSLMQMAKTSAVLAKMADAHLPFISVMSDPTMGGVSASLAMLGDVNIAEPNALIGFAGPRVIEQTVREKLPEGFQHAEFLLEKGAIDMILTRHQMRDQIAELIAKFQGFELKGGTYVKADAPEVVEKAPAKKTKVKHDKAEDKEAELTIAVVSPEDAEKDAEKEAAPKTTRKRATKATVEIVEVPAEAAAESAAEAEAEAPAAQDAAESKDEAAETTKTPRKRKVAAKSEAKE